jgi:hypothetical protein
MSRPFPYRSFRYVFTWALALIPILISALPTPLPAAARPLYAQSRPALSGAARITSTEHFAIHYTLIGVDAVPAADANNDGTPDWVADVGDIMERIWTVEIDQLGWPAPLPDQSEGGDTRFDVYLMELFSKNLAGYVSPDGGLVGDNPNTPRVEQFAAYGYLVLENDFIDPNPPPMLKVWPPEQWARIVAAHEFNHMLQISISGAHAMRWFYEATANWMETQVFPDLPDNLDSAGAVFKSPDTCLLRYGGVNRVESGLHWYGMWVFNQMLAEVYGPDLVLDIWFRMADGAGYVPFDEAFAARDTSFEDVMRLFAVKVLLRDFAHGSAYPVARLEAEAIGPGEWSPADGVQRYAMDIIGLNLGGGVETISLDSEDSGIEGIVVGVRGATADVFPPGRATTVNFGDYDHVYLIVLNLTRPPTEAGCATARYAYTLRPADGSAPTSPASSLSVPTFAPPQVEPVTDPEDIPGLNPFYQTEYHIRDEIKQVDLPFRPIVPRGAPEGYELDSVYGVNADDLDEMFRALNAPSGGVVAQMLYTNEAGQVIRITQSPTIYVAVGDWLAANRLEFAPGTQIWTAGTVDTAIIDRSGQGSGPYLIAFIVRERFLAIDGDADLDAMLDMARRFASSLGLDRELPGPRGPWGEPYASAEPY